MLRTLVGVLASAAVAACGGGSDGPSVVTGGPPVVNATSRTQVATVGAPFSYDATRNGSAFTDPKGQGLTYAVTFSPAANGLTASAGRISGTPSTPGVIGVELTATDVRGDAARQSFFVVAFAAGLPMPTLPA
ncbi:MAG TPA: putative Ig domain-containing protein, partial [Gemmatimonadaceae bacterium]